MVYQQKLVAVIKCNGKILREVDNIVSLPFKSEYEIFIKNLESRDVVVNINIDGEDILDNNSIVIKANSNCSLEGFLKNDKVTNKFKFIQKTKEIQDHRGDRVDDGLIRIEYRFVKINQTITHYHHHINDIRWCHPPWCQCSRCRPWGIYPGPYYVPLICSSPIETMNIGGAVGGGATSSGGHVNSCTSGGEANGCSEGGHIDTHVYNCSGVDESVQSNAFLPQFDEGITVKGSESNQQFSQVHTSPLEDQSYVIVLKLRGTSIENHPIETPILVKTKRKCSTCGRQFKSHIKYCNNCGTALF